MKIRSFLQIALVAFLLAPALAGAEEPMKVYFIGNSLTMNASPARIQKMLAEVGIKMNYSSQLSGGKSLIRHANHAKEPKSAWLTGANFDGKASRKSEFGTYDKALKEHSWDAVVMQLFSSTLHNDLEAISTIIDLCLKNGTCKNFYLYSTWPSRPRGKGDTDYATIAFDYSALWTGDYTAGPDDTSKSAESNYASRSYVNKLLAQLHERYPDLKSGIHVIPVGEVMYQLDQKITSGQLPGVMELAKRNPDAVPGFRPGNTESAGVGMFYRDPLHLKQGLGVFTSATTIATVLSGKSPVGWPVEIFKLEDEAPLLQKIQEVIWEVVTNDPQTGVVNP